MPHFVCLGRGRLGTSVMQGLSALGHEVSCLARRPVPGFTHIPFDLFWHADQQQAKLAQLPGQIRGLLVCVSAGDMVPDAYQMLYGRGMASLAGALEQLPHPPERLFFVSSTAVWGGAEGRLDEDSPQVPANFRGEWLIQAENTLRATGLPLTVLYPGGIYGDRSHRLWQKLDDPDATVRLSGRPLHRIHQQDLAAALVHLMLLEAPATRYLLLDDDPLSQASLLVQMAGMRGVRAPHVTVDLSGPERYFSNARLKAEGFSLKLPSIRDYLRTML